MKRGLIAALIMLLSITACSDHPDQMRSEAGAETSSSPNPSPASNPAAANETPPNNIPRSLSAGDAIRQQIEAHWNIDPEALSAGTPKITIHAAVDPDGTVAKAEIIPDPRYSSNPSYQAIAESARRAVIEASPLRLPSGNADRFGNVTLVFDPSDVLNHGLRGIGKVSKLEGAVNVRHVDGITATLNKGDPVYEGDLLTTNADSAIGMTFTDGTAFALGANGRMVMDALRYDLGSHSGHEAFDVVQGTFSCASGEIARADILRMSIKTPVLTIQARDSTIAGVAAREGTLNEVALLKDGAGAGQVAISTRSGIETLTMVNSRVAVASAFETPPPSVVQSHSQIAGKFGAVLGFLPDE